VYLHPDAVRGHVVKVFLPGLARTDLAFVEAVVFTLRDWRRQAASLGALERLERGLDPSVEMPWAAYALEWWLENVIGLRDVIARGYPTYLVSYDAVLDAPERVIPEVLGWLGRGEPAPAIAAVERGLRRSAPIADPHALDPEAIAVFDALVGRVHRSEPLDEAFVAQIDATHQRLVPQLEVQVSQARGHRNPE
jgi:hypothetical protein